MKLCEKIAEYGPISLSDHDLITAVLGSDKKVGTLLSQYELSDGQEESDVLRLSSLPFDELKNKGGLTDLETSRLMAAIELGVRIATAGIFNSINKKHTTSPGEVARYLMPRLRYLNQEVFGIILFNAKNRIIGTKIITKGVLNASLVSCREVFGYALAGHAAAIIAFHNHPSGFPTPSREDRDITEMLKKAGEIMEVRLLDHIIIGDGIYYSFQEEAEI